MKKTIQTHGARYGMAGGVSCFATAIAMRAPFLSDLPLEVSVPVVMAIFHFVIDFIKTRFKVDATAK
jgi:hypothetical protein